MGGREVWEAMGDMGDMDMGGCPYHRDTRITMTCVMLAEPIRHLSSISPGANSISTQPR